MRVHFVRGWFRVVSPCLVFIGLITAIGFTAVSFAQVPAPVLQRGYDAAVTGADLNETTLNVSNVNTQSFGEIQSIPVDDNVFAQPLYVPGVVIPSQGMHDVLYVATMNDTVYAFDADTGGAALWSVNLASIVGATPVNVANFVYSNSKNIIGHLGILSTPVIDPSTNIMYVVACTLESNTLVYRLHALDITGGHEPYGPGVVISASYGGITFNARNLWQRASLTLSGSHVVVAFGALELEFSGGYSGWVLGYDKQSLQQTGAFATANSSDLGAGVWMSGRPPVVDGSGNVYVFTGNGYGCCGYDGTGDFSESALKLDPASGMALADWFTPSVWHNMDTSDQDLSSSGPLLIPGTNLLAGGGKTSILYVLNTAKGQMGQYSPTDKVVQELSLTTKQFRGGPVWWQRSSANGGPLLFNWGVGDAPKSFAFTGSQFTSSPASTGAGTAVWPGGILTLSATADQAGTGILWAAFVTSGDDNNNPPAPGELLAFNANDLTQQLWNSQQDASHDAVGNFGKLVPPTVANGRVYLATQSNKILVYGLKLTLAPNELAFGDQPIHTSSTSQSITLENVSQTSVTISGIALSGSNASMYSQSNNCGSTIAAAGSCTVSVVFAPTSNGAADAQLKVSLSGGAVQTASLTGTGTASAYTLAPNPLSFGNVVVNTSSQAEITLTNTSGATLPVTSVAVSGSNGNMFRQTNNCGSAIAAGGNCAVTVVFKPISTAAKSAKLTVKAGSGGTTQTVIMTGTGVASPLTLAPSSLPFGNVIVHGSSAAMQVTVTNMGGSALPITAVAVSGSNPNMFTQTSSCGSSIAAGGQCTVNVTFKPGSVGAKSATLGVTAGTTGGTQTVPMTGIGVSPSFTTAPNPLAFGSVAVSGSGATMTVTVTNTSGAVLPITAIAISGSNPNMFRNTNNCGASIAASSQCSVSVTFKPLTKGAKSANLNVTAASSTTQTVPMTGTGE